MDALKFERESSFADIAAFAGKQVVEPEPESCTHLIPNLKPNPKPNPKFYPELEC